jgi:putative flavoprotein involved in K+ transport
MVVRLVLDVLVIGGGQAGLAMGYHLRQAGQGFAIVDAASEIGDSWRSRWDSLVLFTPAQFDDLPGLPFPANDDTYPTKDDVATYLKTYAATFELPVRTNTRVSSVAKEGDRYVATTEHGPIEAARVVVATGPFQTPFVPDLSAGADPAIAQLHSSSYKRPDDLPSGPVLVVGGGNSGCQIARELAASHRVELAIAKTSPVVPQRLLGRDVWWWGSKLGVSKVTIGSKLGRRLSTRDPIIGQGPRSVAKAGVTLRKAVRSIAGRSVTFEDEATSEPAAIVWATGFRGSYGWIDVPGVLDEQGRPRHRRGITPAPGFFFLGLSWQWTRGSALLGWVGDDAAHLADGISRGPSPR